MKIIVRTEKVNKPYFISWYSIRVILIRNSNKMYAFTTFVGALVIEIYLRGCVSARRKKNVSYVVPRSSDRSFFSVNICNYFGLVNKYVPS